MKILGKCFPSAVEFFWIIQHHELEWCNNFHSRRDNITLHSIFSPIYLHLHSKKYPQWGSRSFIANLSCWRHGRQGTIDQSFNQIIQIALGHRQGSHTPREGTLNCMWYPKKRAGEDRLSKLQYLTCRTRSL